MATPDGWIKLHRSLIDWEWYNDIPTKVLFIHLLLTANHAPKKWRGMDIDRGQLFTSFGHLAEQTGLSVKQIRTSMNKLEKTGETASKGASNGTMITVCKYDSYQADAETDGKQKGKRGANEGQTKGNKQEYKNVTIEERESVSAPTHALTKWIAINTPTIQSLKEPLTDAQAEQLLADLNINTDIKRTRLKDVLTSMENKPDLLKKYKSANLTIRKWWKIETDRNPIIEYQQQKRDTTIPHYR